MEKTVISIKKLVAADDSHVTVVFCAECGGIVRDCPHDNNEYMTCEW